MQPDKIVTPGSYVDFLHYLDTVTTEEELFSRLTYWFANRNTADDVRDRFDVVEDRAKELKLWNGLDLKLERWARANKEELARIGKDAFGALICADYAAYQEGGQAQQGNAQPLKVHSARELAEMLIPPIRYIVDELVPVGLGVLVAKPKIGKSWMILDLCLAVAAGEPFLNFPTHQHGTLYLALEDGPSRMQRRIKKLMEGRQAPENMHALFDAPRMDEGLLDVLGSYLDEHPEIHLVCIDTLSKVKPKAKPFENAYDADYDYMGILKKFADSRGICLLIVHHTRKGKNMDDAFDNINGSTGIMGAADFTIVLDKQNRMDDDASFILTGRDIEQQERVISFDKARCRWIMQGTAAEIAAQRKVQEYENSPIVQTLRINLVEKYLQQVDELFKNESKRSLVTNQDYSFDGANSVCIYKVGTAAMNDYDRAGVTTGNRYGNPETLTAVTETYTLPKDRSFSFVIDRLDMDETGAVLEAAKCLARQQREVVIPEIDAYTYGIMCTDAGTKPDAVALTATNIYDEICKASAALDDAEVPETNRVLVVSA